MGIGRGWQGKHAFFYFSFSCPVKNHDVRHLHQQEMEQAAESAKKKYLEEHPEARDMVLKYDPLKHLDDCEF